MSCFGGAAMGDGTVIRAGLGYVGVSSGYDFERFVVAQEAGDRYSRAIDELRFGNKVGHWMWFVFPQLAGLGQSTTSRRYAISSLAEAKAYLNHRILGPRLIECARVICESEAVSAETIFGRLDAQKLRSSITLFLRAQPNEPLFAAVIDRYFEGQPDCATDELLARASEGN
jgi:uncharacterized protein (DUF1810 family)